MADKKKSKEQAGKRAKELVINEPNNLFSAWICVAAIALVTYIAFSPSLNGFFTNWDDLDYVVNNPLVASKALKLREIFTMPVMGNYTPVTILTLAWNFQNGEFDPKGYHGENVVFHIFNTILVFFFIFQLTRRNMLMAGVTAFFFGLHPMHVESVSWVSERKDVLYVFFFLAGLITYLRYSDSKKIGWYVATLLLFVLSCLSKGMAVVFPVILLLVDYVKEAKWERKIFFEKIPFFLLALGFGILTYKIQQSSQAIDIVSFTFPQKLMFASYSAMMYLVKFLVPYNLSAVYPYPALNKNGNIPFFFYLCPFILIGIVALIYFFLRKEKAIVFGLLFYLVSVVLVLQIISVGSLIMADRYSYLAYIGLAFVIAYILNEAWQGKNSKLLVLKYPLAAVIVIGGIIFTFQTYARTQVWHDCETLWTDVMQKDSSIFLAYKNRGYYYQEINEDDKALQDYNKVLQLNPNYVEAYNNRGNIYNKRKQYGLALADYSKAITIDSVHAVFFANRGICYSNINQYEKAIADYSKAIKIEPSSPNNYLNRSRSEYALGRKEEAKADAIKAQQLGAQVDNNYLSLLGAK